MTRGDKGDSTQPLSDSQVVAVSKQGVDKNDRSVWKGLVVGADEFAPPPKPKRSRAPWLVAGVVVAAGAGIGAYELSGSGGDTPSTPAPAVAPPPAVKPPADAAPPMDAAPPVDAAVPVDAGAPPDAATKPAPTTKKKTKKPAPKKRIMH